MGRERVEALVSELVVALEEYATEGAERVAAVDKSARKDVARYNAIRAELPALEERAVALHTELERLPVDHSRAALTDDPDEQARIKARHGEIVAELEALEARRAALDAELGELNPRQSSPPHPRDVDIRRLDRVADENIDVLEAFEKLRERVTNALKTAEAPFATRARELQGRIDDLNRQRSADIARSRRETAPVRR